MINIWKYLFLYVRMCDEAGELNPASSTYYLLQTQIEEIINIISKCAKRNVYTKHHIKFEIFHNENIFFERI